MTLASDLRNIVAAARPTVEEWIDIGEQFVGFRDACKAKGLDWGQIKGLLKAQVLDERDGGKRVEKIVQKADFASSYAAMLGLLPGNVNENNCSDESLADSEPPPSPAVAPPAMTASADQESAVPSPIVASSTPSDDDATAPRAGRSREQSPARGDIDIDLPSFLDRKSPDCIANRAQGRG